MNLLLVDDHAVVRSGIRDIVSVSEPKATFAEAATAQEALELLTAQHFDLVILDLSLPDANGLTLLPRIRAIAPDLPVLVLSMHPEDGYAQRALQAGAQAYLNKASVPAELVSAIRQIFQENASQDQAWPAAEPLSETTAVSPSRKLLSEREWHVLRLLAHGHRLTHIAQELNVHPKTVSTYKSRIMKKLNIENNAQLLRYALEQGLAEL